MKVLHVVRSMKATAGGVAEAVRLMCIALPSHGYECAVASFDSDSQDTSLAVDFYPLGTGGGKYGFSFAAYLNLTKLISKFDLVVIHGVWQFHSFAAYLASRKSKVDFVLMPHGMLDPWFKKQYPLKNLKKRIYWLFFEQYVARFSRCILFTCQEELEQAKSDFLSCIDSRKLQVLGFGIEDPVEKFSLKIEAIPVFSDYKKVLFLGRVDPKKSLDIVIKGFSWLLKTDPDVVLVIAGPGDESYVAYLRKLADELGVSENIKWLGMVRGVDKWKLLASPCLFVLPSHQENFGISVVEALAFNKFVIVSNKVNIWPDVVKLGGGLVCDDTEDSFKEALLSYSRITKGSFGFEARNTYLKFFTVNLVGANFKKIIEGL